ncbi:MAG: InlB B-repeat-containing protein, partial [Oscillospiraceae bacterium]|nr:InlB B-repeat-containing protein [Oscillospiraceae bacterium]
FTKDGHTFAGWTIGTNDHAVGAQITIDGNVTVVARWTPNPHTVTYQAGTGQGADHPVSVVFGETHNLLSNTTTLFTKDGHTFAGWRIGTNDYAVGAPITISGNVTVVARWNPNPHTVTYELGIPEGDGVIGLPHIVDVFFGETHTLLSNTVTGFVNAGHTFVGWTINGVNFAVGADIVIDGDVTAIARWTTDLSVTFRFRDNNALDHEVVVPITFDQPIDPTVIADIMDQANVGYGEATQGFAFWGWFTDQELATSGRTLPSTSTNINAGQRRPVVGAMGFCYRYGFTISEALFTQYSQNNTIVLYAVWSLWGDVNDDDLVTFEDATLIQFYMALFPNIQLVRPAGDVTRTGSLTFEDATLIQFYVALFPNIHLGRPQNP